MKNKDKLKEQVKSYWDAGACGTSIAKSEEGTKEYFDQVEEHRYNVEPCIHQFAQFTRWHGKKVLEIGCGAGTDFLQFARAGADINGIDLTPKSVELINKRLKLYNVKGTIKQGDAENLQFDDNEFDLVYSWGVIHHSPNTEKTIEEIYRVTKPGGHVCIMIYNHRSLLVWKMYVKYGLLAGKPFRSMSDVIYNHMESIGTKAYTISEARAMFSMFSDVVVERVLTKYDTDYLPTFLTKLIPQSFGWFMVVKGRKPM